MTDEPWWHSAPDEPPVDSVLEEGLKLFAVLKDWAVESGALAVVSDLTSTAATSASAYIAHIQDNAEAEVEVEVVDATGVHPVRCADCPVCRGLTALESSNPQLAETARSALSGVNSLIAGLLRG